MNKIEDDILLGINYSYHWTSSSLKLHDMDMNIKQWFIIVTQSSKIHHANFPTAYKPVSSNFSRTDTIPFIKSKITFYASVKILSQKTKTILIYKWMCWLQRNQKNVVFYHRKY